MSGRFPWLLVSLAESRLEPPFAWSCLVLLSQNCANVRDWGQVLRDCVSGSLGVRRWPFSPELLVPFLF